MVLKWYRYGVEIFKLFHKKCPIKYELLKIHGESEKPNWGNATESEATGLIKSVSEGMLMRLML